jgi:hypothetical protein
MSENPVNSTATPGEGTISSIDSQLMKIELERDEGKTALPQSSPDVWGRIDGATDDLIHPTMRAGETAPGTAAPSTVYQNFLAKLMLAH